ncbi:MAG TPA: DUF3788 family protein [Bacteroidales bacterium]|nr:DUF3788 family protein [Bacteroidales bacterium]
MSELLKPTLADPTKEPDDELIASLVGKKIDLWRLILKHAENSYNDVSGRWNYYKDGKQWLFKFVRKKKTLFWAGIFNNTFRITFYFGDKAESNVLSSDLPSEIREGFKTARRFGSIRPISIVLSEQSDVENVYKLIEMKNRIR